MNFDISKIDPWGWSLLGEPFILIILALLVWLGYLATGHGARRKKRKRDDLQRQALREAEPAKRRELLMAWNEMGGLEQKRVEVRKRAIRAQGQKARISGQSASDNPFPSQWWGYGKQWRRGWKGVDRNIRWLYKQRKRVDA